MSEDVDMPNEDYYIDQHIEEYCIELCYHERLCELDPDCIDYDCYHECCKKMFMYI